MTETISPPETPAAEIPPTSPSPFPARPHTDAAALVLSEHVRGTSILDKIADGVNRFCSSMYVFIVDQILARVDTRPAVG